MEAQYGIELPFYTENMKNVFLIFILLSCVSMLSFSQEKIEFGVTTEGSYFMPHQETEYLGWATKNGFGAGIGAYASRNLFGRISADIGLTYRYKQMQQQYEINGKMGGSGDSGETESDGTYGYLRNGAMQNWYWDKLPLHHIVIPFHLQMLLSKSIFISGGIETTWLINYESVREKPEFNWTLGFGSQKYKLKWSVNYIRGFAEQGFLNETPESDGHYKGSINRNNMIQLKLSYPIGQLNF